MKSENLQWHPAFVAALRITFLEDKDYLQILEEYSLSKSPYPQGKEYCKTKNVIKKEKLLLILNHRLTNIRHDHLHLDLRYR